MKRIRTTPKTTRLREQRAARWAHRLMAKVQAVVAAHPSADPDTVRHALILLEHPPLERLQRSLLRGRFASP